MRILVSGSSGFVGRALVPFLRKKGNEVVLLKRGESTTSASAEVVFWNPQNLNSSLPAPFFDAVVHLAGEPISGRWSAQKMRKILLSRTLETRALSEWIAQNPPKVFLSPSAVGYYGDRGEELLTEESLSGAGFLPEVCRGWEEASSLLVRKGCRVVHPRFGMILGKEGGVLQKMLTPMNIGLGGVFGSGTQWVSWISLRDAVSVIDLALHEPKLSGAFNAVAPGVVRQREFAQSVAAHLHRRQFFRSHPAWFLRLIFKRMADEVLLASARVDAVKLRALKFPFLDDHLDTALRELVRK